MNQTQGNVEDELADAAAKCREALADPKFTGLDARLPGAPRDAEGWFELLRGFPHTSENYAVLAGMQAALPANAVIADACASILSNSGEGLRWIDAGASWPRSDKHRGAGVNLGHYAALAALPVAASRIAHEPVPDSVKRLYIAFIRQIAARAKHWENHFDVEGPRFHDLAHLASLRRYPAGEVGFQFWPRLSPFYGLRIHPLDWPGFFCELACRVRGIGPTVSLHFNYARENWLVLPQKEFERSLWRIAKALEYHPRVRALTSCSWFHSPLVAQTFPRLAWMRGVFTEGGAYAVDLEPGQEDDIGYNSAKRRQLYDEGTFCPRQTLIIWPREEFLAWAASRPELADEGEKLSAQPARKRHIHIKPGPLRRAAKHNSPLTLWDGKELFQRSGVRYALAVLLLPALGFAALAALAIGWLAAFPAFVVGLCAAYIFQYYFFQ